MLIGLHGKKQAGKDTVHQRIEKLLGPGSETGAAVERVSFADLLYESAAAALGVTVDFLREWKSDPRAGLSFRLPEGADAFPIERTYRGPSFREYLQFYGTEAHRGIFGDDFWVENVSLNYHERKIVVVTDVRFPNEAQAVINAGGHIVHVIGPDAVENTGDGHASEKGLSSSLIDHVLYNKDRGDGFASLDDGVLDLVLRILREERS